jgi:hypothetical protein
VLVFQWPENAAPGEAKVEVYRTVGP